jgi:hypothetical protein
MYCVVIMTLDANLDNGLRVHVKILHMIRILLA